MIKNKKFWSLVICFFVEQITSQKSLERFCSYYYIYTSSFTPVLNITLKPLIVELALFNVLGVALCVGGGGGGAGVMGENLHFVWPK